MASWVVMAQSLMRSSEIFKQVCTHIRENQFKANLCGCWLKALVPHEGLSIRLVMIRFLLEKIIREREKRRKNSRENSVFSITLLEMTWPHLCHMLFTDHKVQFQYDVQGYCTRMNISKGKDHLRGILTRFGFPVKESTCNGKPRFNPRVRKYP